MTRIFRGTFAAVLTGIICMVAHADEAVVIKDTRSVNTAGVPYQGEVLTRSGTLCEDTKYRHTTGGVELPVVDRRTFECNPDGTEIAAAAPTASAAAAKAPIYHLAIDVLGSRRTVVARVGDPIRLSQSIHFAYMGACLSDSDTAAIRKAVLSGGDADTVSANIHSAAESRPPHVPSKGESPELKTGEWDYDLTIVPSAIAADGSVTLEVSGSASGPEEHYDPALAGQCNGFKPVTLSENIFKTPLTVHGAGELRSDVLGMVKFNVIQP